MIIYFFCGVKVMKTVVIDCKMDYDLDELHGVIAQKLSYGKDYKKDFDDLESRLMSVSDEVLFVFENEDLINDDEGELRNFVEKISKQNPNVRTINR